LKDYVPKASVQLSWLSFKSRSLDTSSECSPLNLMPRVYNVHTCTCASIRLLISLPRLCRRTLPQSSPTSSPYLTDPVWNMRPDLETVPNQLGTASLRLDTGAILSQTGQMDTPLGSEAAHTLYQILLDTGLILKAPLHHGEALRRIAVQFRSFQYVMTVSKDEVFIVKKTPDDTRG